MKLKDLRAKLRDPNLEQPASQKPELEKPPIGAPPICAGCRKIVLHCEQNDDCQGLLCGACEETLERCKCFRVRRTPRDGEAVCDNCSRLFVTDDFASKSVCDSCWLRVLAVRRLAEDPK